MNALISRRTLTHVMAPLAAVGALLPGSGALAADGGGRVAERFYPVARAPKKGLVVYLDGDGQELHDAGDASTAPGGLTGPRSLVEAARSRGYDVLSVRSPESDTWWTDETTADDDAIVVEGGLSRAEKISYLVEAIDRARSDRRANTETLWLVGYSGGSEFITEFFFPAYASSMRKGGFIVFGGGDVPAEGLQADSFFADSKASLSLNWVTGTLDLPQAPEWYDGIGHAREGHSGYAAAGFHGRARATWLPGHDHEGIVSVFGAHVGEILDAYREESL